MKKLDKKFIEERKKDLLERKVELEKLAAEAPE